MPEGLLAIFSDAISFRSALINYRMILRIQSLHFWASEHDMPRHNSGTRIDDNASDKFYWLLDYAALSGRFPAEDDFTFAHMRRSSAPLSKFTTHLYEEHFFDRRARVYTFARMIQGAHIRSFYKLPADRASIHFALSASPVEIKAHGLDCRDKMLSPAEEYRARPIIHASLQFLRAGCSLIPKISRHTPLALSFSRHDAFAIIISQPYADFALLHYADFLPARMPAWHRRYQGAVLYYSYVRHTA